MGIRNSNCNFLVLIFGLVLFGSLFVPPVHAASLWTNSTTPKTTAVSDGNPWEVGVKFTSDVAGYVTAIRFYKGPGNSGTHIGHLWSSTGKLLASATFTNETPSGWQQADFAQAVQISANAVYVASYWDPKGHYSLNSGYFTTEYSSAPLHAPVNNGADGSNGVYVYGSSSFPTEGYQASNYWVDLVFVANAGNSPQLSANPASIAFGNVPLGSTSTQAVSFTNTGSGAVTLSQASVTGTGFSLSGLLLPLTLSPGQSVSASVSFAPSAAGSLTGSISVVSNASNSPVTVALSGTGTALQLSASPTSLSFGNVTVGTSSILPVVITNTGNQSVTISQVILAGAGFSASGLTFPATLTPGQNVTLSITFAPSSAGAVTGSISVISNATNSPAASVFSATGANPHSATVSWVASTSTNVTGYNVYRGAGSGGPYTKMNSSLVSGTSYKDTTVQTGETYYYVVTSLDSAGNESAYSSFAEGAVPSP